MHWASLHGLHCIQSGSIAPKCMEYSAFNDAAWNPPNLTGIHYTKLYRIHCIQSGCILISCMESIQSSRCMDSTAYSRDPLCHNAWNPLHSIGMHFTRLPGIHAFITLHGLHCIQSGSIAPQCMEYSAFNDAPWNPLHSIRMLWAMLHKIHCIQSCCMESTAFNHAA